MISSFQGSRIVKNFLYSTIKGRGNGYRGSFARIYHVDGKRYSVLETEKENPIFQIKQSFQELCPQSPLIEFLNSRNYSVATDIQSKSFQPILNKKDVIIGAETGSGKTLAYFLPVLEQAIRERKAHAVSSQAKKVIILTPSSELADQVLRMTKFLIDGLNQDDTSQYRVVIERRAEKCLSWIPKSPPVDTPDPERDSLSPSNLLEMIVCTPRNLLDIIRVDDPYTTVHPLYDLSTIILDEADMLLDGAYLKDVEKIIEHLKLIRRNKIRQQLIDVNTPTVQYILAAASLPSYGLKSIEKIAQRLFPRTTLIRTNYLHQHHPQIRQEYLPLSPRESETPILLLQKMLAVLQGVVPGQTDDSIGDSSGNSEIESGVQPSWWSQLDGSIMIFFNTAIKAQYFANLVRNKATIPCVEMHSLLSKEERQMNLDKFRQEPEQYRVLVCTDACARGLDLPFVKYVIQAEFALNVVQHLHRIGRASRAGREGVAINFYAPESILLVQSIRGKDREYNMLVSEESVEVGSSNDKGSTRQGLSSIERSFSRKRGFRRKIKKQTTLSDSLPDRR